MNNTYTPLDRLLHRLAFSNAEILKAVADIEDGIYASRFATVETGNPLFITSLPRAGTTLLLQTLCKHPSFVTHTYRDMPLVLCPLFWDAISRPFRKEGGVTLRAHGDGMVVTYDSPEAFEEMLWLAFWPEKYSGGRIRLWRRDDSNGEFDAFFRKHIRKLIALRALAGSKARYVSKNNANIGRVAFLHKMFPDATILVPVRNPVDHVGSLLRQHRNFTEIHRADPFVKRYMEGIGHFEFGGSHRKIDFGFSQSITRDLNSGNYWLNYWIEAFSYLISLDAPSLRIFDYDRACSDPAASMQSLAHAVDIVGEEVAALDPGVFRSPTHYDPGTLELDAALLERALVCHKSIIARAIN